MQEIEAKFYVRDLKKIETCLQDLEARLIQPRVLETNLRFDLPDGGLRSEGRVLRLRQDIAARLTYKDSGKNEQGILRRREIEFGVDDFEKARHFLEALGYQQILIYEKYRTTYELADCHIMLDELPYGNFVEIEGTAHPAIRAVADTLGLDMSVSVTVSYAALFERVRQVLQLTFTDLTFANFSTIEVSPEDLSVSAADKAMPKKRD